VRQLTFILASNSELFSLKTLARPPSPDLSNNVDDYESRIPDSIQASRGWMNADHRRTTAAPECCCDNTINLTRMLNDMHYMG